MRSHEVEARRSRTLTDLFDAALSLLGQDIAEYGFSALLGAIAAGLAAVVLYIAGGIVGLSLVAPTVFAIALLTYANAAAAIRRVQDNLEPDSVRALAAVLSRLPALFSTALLPLAVTFAAVFCALAVDDFVGSELAITFAMVIVAAAALPPFQRSLWVPAMFARDATFSQATERGTQAMHQAGAIVATAFAVALIPTGLLALYALGTSFHVVATALTSFVFVATTPVLAALASLILEHTAPEQRPAERRRRAKQGQGPVEERLTRHMR